MLMTFWSLLEECVSQLAEPFRRSEIIGWFRWHHPEVNEATLAAHIQAATVNATNRAQNNPLGTRPPLLRRVEHGLYVRAAENPGPAARVQPQATPEQPGSRRGQAAGVVLIGCVRTKRAIACAAAELFASPLFDGRRRYAVGSGLPWYILSAKFGLLAPEDVIGPYDVYLGEQSPATARRGASSSPPNWSSGSRCCAGAPSRCTRGSHMSSRCVPRWPLREPC